MLYYGTLKGNGVCLDSMFQIVAGNLSLQRFTNKLHGH
jgi:hypothetical protein